MERLGADGAGVALVLIFVYHDSRTLVPGASPTYKLHVPTVNMLCGGAACGAGK